MMNAKRLWFFLLANLLFLPMLSDAQQQAHARLYCLSLQFQKGFDSTTEYSLQMDNGELWYYDSSSYAANVTLNDEWIGEPYQGYIKVPIPGFTDANGNGFPDFFESVQGVDSTTTSGSYNLSGWGSGALQATWSRAAGTSYGSCSLKLPGPFFNTLTFSLSFQLLEYSGPLTYTPGTTQVTGRVDLVQTDYADSLYGGPVTFVKTTTNRFNALMLQPDSWTNAWQQTMTYTNDLFTRDVHWPTNYYGYVIFDDDADPTTPYPFDVWVLSIDDLNDANHNGIPDFSDDPSGPVLPRQPRLLLTAGTNNLWLTIAGDVGHVHQVQETLSLPSTNWVTVWSQSLTNDPQVVSLPPPSEPAKFWRVVAQ